MLMQQQDETLDHLSAGVGRVKALAGVMRDELGEQAVILDSLDDDMDKADTSMRGMQRKLKAMVNDAKRSDRTLYAIICCLSVLFVILFFMVLE